MARSFLESLPEEAYLALIEFCAAGLNAFVVYGIYKTCRKAEDIYGVLKDTPSFEIGNELVTAVGQTQSKTLPYVAVRGKVLGTGEIISPSRNGVPSVIRLTDHQEIYSKYSWNGSRYTYVGKKFETQEFIPFYLAPVTECPISINFVQNKDQLGNLSSTSFKDPNKKNTYSLGLAFPVLLIKDITVPDMSELLQTFPTYLEKSDYKTESKISEFFDYIFGIARVSGIQKSEKLLPTNEIITVLGRIVQSDHNQYTLTAPWVPNSLYMLTTRRFEEIILEFSVKTALGYFVLFVFTCGGILLVVDAVKRLKSLYDLRYSENTDEELNDCDTNLYTEGQSCVICQERPRNVVLMNCRHFCICDNCSNRLDGRCPVCRQAVHSNIRIFVS